MANIKVSELPTATKFNDDDYTMIVQNNTTKKITKENMYGNYIFSTNETVVGKWIDDKPIYRKVITTNSLVGSEDYKQISHGISNIDNIVSLKCIAKDENDVSFDFNNFTGTTENNEFINSIKVFVDNTDIFVYHGAIISFVNEAHFILEYTKTTD